MIRPYLLQAITPLHVGGDPSAGWVDLPLARETHTDWPWIPGSSLKGALRQRAAWTHTGPGDMARIARAFGSIPGDRDAQRGLVLVGSARLLALPVRSVKGTYVLATCPLALATAARDLAVGRPAPPVPRPTTEQALVGARSPAAFPHPGAVGGEGEGELVALEELVWVAVRDPAVEAWASWLGTLAGEADVPWSRLAVVHDRVFQHATRRWTEVRTRNRIGKDGVVEDGFLFTVEVLPQETLLWGTVRDGDLPDLLPAEGETFVVGGDRSVGMGRVAWFLGGGEA